MLSDFGLMVSDYDVSFSVNSSTECQTKMSKNNVKKCQTKVRWKYAWKK